MVANALNSFWMNVQFSILDFYCWIDIVSIQQFYHRFDSLRTIPSPQERWTQSNLRLSSMKYKCQSKLSMHVVSSVIVRFETNLAKKESRNIVTKVWCHFILKKRDFNHFCHRNFMFQSWLTLIIYVKVTCRNRRRRFWSQWR